MKSSLLDRILPYVNAFVSSKIVTAIKDGLIFIMPLTIIGSAFLLVPNLPIPGYSDFMAGIFGANWADPFNQVVGSTFDILALGAVFAIAYTYVKNEGFNGVPTGMLAMVCFLIMNNHYVVADAANIGGVFPKEFLGSKGMIGAIFVGLTVGYIYAWCLKNKLEIKMPESVPTGVASAFTSLIPGAICMTLMAVLYAVFKGVFNKTFLELVYQVLQTPLQGLSSSFVGVILIVTIISMLWWTGVHGSSIVMGIMGPLLLANSIANQALIDSGVKLVAGDNAYIVTGQFIEQYVTVTGSGFTLGLVFLMMFRAKSEQFKQIGKMSLAPGLFNINEPVLFGTPIVLNPYMFLPFVLAPLSSAIILYVSIASGFLPPFGSVIVPWTTPIVISGLLIGGYKAAIVQLVCLVVTTFVYYPFFKIVDKQALDSENK